MNAPAENVDLGFRTIPIEDLSLSTTQVQGARRRRYDDAALNELAESIRMSGVLQPLLVRPTPKGETPYQIVAGERRYLASKRAGLVNVPAIVRAMSDAMVLEAQLVENVQRESLDPLAEAWGYQELMTLRGITADELAEIVGKSRSAVYTRLKLLQLHAPGREALERGELDASRALLVARIVDPKDQAKALKLAIEKDWRGENPRYSYRDLLQEIGRKGATVALTSAPFPLDDATLLPDAGPCTTCPHRTGNTPLGITVDDPDVCTKAFCYKLKVRAATSRREAEAAAAGQEIIRGDAAKKIAPRKGELAGYVDLDAACDDDHFPEDEPEDVDSPAWEAWNTKENAWRPRTYRQLLGDSVVPVTLLEDPATKQIRELVPVAEARAALKKKDIHLSDFTGRSFYQPPKSPSEYAAERAREEKRYEAELSYRTAVLKAIFPKALGPITHAELSALAVKLAARSYVARDALKPLYGDAWKSIGSWSAPEIGRLLRLLDAAEESRNSYGAPKSLLALTKVYKVDAAAIRKSLDEPKQAPAKKAKPVKPAKKAAAKKPAAKKAKK